MSAAPRPERALGAAALIFGLAGAFFATWAVNLPAIRDGLHLSEGQLGTALLAVGVGSLLSMPLTGAWVARWGSDRVTAAAAALSMPVLALPFLVPTLPALLAALLICLRVRSKSRQHALTEATPFGTHIARSSFRSLIK